MSTNRYHLAGWLSIIGAVLIVPSLITTTILVRLSEAFPIAAPVIALMYVLSLMASVYVLHMFRLLLNEQFDFHGVDSLITILIGFTVFSTVLGLVGLVPGLSHAVAIVMLILFFFFGIVTIIYGISLLKLKDDLYGLLKPFAYLTVASGICSVSILLIPFGLLAAITALFLQGMIFLRTKEEMEFV